MGGSRFLLTAVAFGVACGPGRVTPPQAPVSGDQTPREPVDASTPDTSPSADAGTTANPADGGMPQARLSVLCDSPDAPSGLTIDGFTWENPLPWGFEIAAAWSPSADEAWFIPAVPVGDAVRLLHRTPSGFEAVTAPGCTSGSTRATSRSLARTSGCITNTGRSPAPSNWALRRPRGPMPHNGRPPERSQPMICGPSAGKTGTLRTSRGG